MRRKTTAARNYLHKSSMYIVIACDNIDFSQVSAGVKAAGMCTFFSSRRFLIRPASSIPGR